MAGKALEVKFTANTKALESGFKKVHEGVRHLAEAFLVFEAAKKGVEFLTDTVKAAAADQAAMAILGNQVKAAGEDWNANSKAVNENLVKMSELSGFTKTDLATSLGRLETSTHSLTKSQKLLGEAQDVARARGMDVVTASQLLAKVYNGNTGAARKLGLATETVSKHQDRLKAKHMELIASGKKLTDAQKLQYEQDMKQAKADDKRSSGLATLTTLQKQFGGASAAYANTSAGAMARLSAIWHELEISIGQKFLPVVALVASWLADHLPAAIDKLNAYWAKLQPPINRVIVILKAHVPQAIALLRHAFQEFVGFVTTIWRRWGTDIEHIVVHAFQIILPVVKTAITLIKTIILTAAALLEGHWGQAWDRIKKVPGQAFAVIKSVLKAAVTVVGNIAGEIGKAILHGIMSAVSGLAGLLESAVKGAFNYGVIDPANSLINKLVGVEKSIPGSPNLGIGSNPIPRLAAGGIVTKPTLALIGEAGPEAVVPLSGHGAAGINVYVNKTGADPREIGAAVSWALRMHP